MQIPFKPETIFTNSTTEVMRAKVPGGWLVNIVVNGRNSFEFTTSFIADPEWQWEV
jgi:hypothetical protein